MSRNSDHAKKKIAYFYRRYYHQARWLSSSFGRVKGNCSEISRTDILREANRIFCSVLPVDSPYFTPLLMYNNTISIFQNITIIDGDAGYRKSLGGTCR